MADTDGKESHNHLIKNSHILNVCICSVAIPLSMLFWLANIFYKKLTNNDGYDEPVIISPARWLASCILPLTIAAYGYRKKSVNLSGAITGVLVAFVLTLSNYCFFMSLLVFFISSSKATKFRQHIKRRVEENFKEGGQRNWIQVLCNGGVATQLALLYLVDVGASERPVDFLKDYRASWLSVAVLGSMSCANGDTWASELGTVLGSSDPYLVTTWKRVPKGTNGGVTLQGTVCSVLGGLVVGAAYYGTLVYFSEAAMLEYAPPQWPVLVCGALAGGLGSLIDSLLGATLQYTGLDKNGKIVSHSSVTVRHISGRNILDNHSVNLISIVLTSLIMPELAKAFWPVR